MNAFVEALNRADVIRVDDGPLLTGFEYDADDEAVVFRSTDEDGEIVTVIPAVACSEGQHSANGFRVTDADGQSVKVELFKLVPDYPVPPKISDGWLKVFHQADKERVIFYGALQGVMDSLVDAFIGGHDGCSANHAGFHRQIEALYAATEGQLGPIVCGLARRLSLCTTYSKQSWEQVLENPDIQGSLCERLDQLDQAA